MAKTASRSRAFFLELVISLAFFALCAAICLQIFARATLRSDESGALAQASLRAQSVAETFKATGGDAGRTAALFDKNVSDGGFTLYYDGEWAPSEEGGAVFRLTCSFESTGSMNSAFITAFNGEDEIYALSAKKYQNAAADGIPLARESQNAVADVTPPARESQNAAADAAPPAREYRNGGDGA
jgi:hypothetical protein